jgi:dTDP-4-amino-4,6-dideoxygalactose transaminase
MLKRHDPSGFDIPLARPLITEADIDAVTNVLRSGVLTQGEDILALEKALCLECNVPHAVAVSSGTAALHLLLLADGVDHHNVVYTTPFTFAASAMCALYTGAKVRFVDVDPYTWNLCPEATMRACRVFYGSRRQAVMAVDVFGVPMDIQALRRVLGLTTTIYEDAAEALGSFMSYPGKSYAAGTHPATRAGVVAFYPNKQIVAGEGGAILTNDEELDDKLRILRNNGRAVGEQEIVALGYNYRMDEMSAALAFSQMTRLESIRRDRQFAASYYRALLQDTSCLQLQSIPPGAIVNPFVFVVVLRDQRDVKLRDEVIRRMAFRSIQCRAYFENLQRQPLFRDLVNRGQVDPGYTPIADGISNGAIALPFAQGIERAAQDRVVRELLEVLKEVELL